MVVTAIFTLLGVALGAGLGFVFDVMRERRAEKAEFRTAARLLHKEMRGVNVLVASAIGKEEGFAGGQLFVKEWPRFESVMAAHLDADDWRAVSGALAAMAILSPGFRPGMTLSPESVESLKILKGSLDNGIGILGARIDFVAPPSEVEAGQVP